MTETEWLACNDPRLMFEFLRIQRNAARRAPGRRKLRLFACACLRGIWSVVRQLGSRHAVAVAERFAEGLATDQELNDADAAARKSLSDEAPELRKASAFWQSAEAAVHVTARRFDRGDHVSVAHATSSAANAWALEQRQAGATQTHDELKRERLTVSAGWLREIAGNPFHSRAKNPAWLTSTVKSLAESLIAEESFEHLPVLADALEDAGCNDVELLEHLRGAGPHLRGCWALDSLVRAPAWRPSR